MTDLETLVRRYLDAYDRARQPPPRDRLGRSYSSNAKVVQDRYLSRDKALARLREAVEQADQ